ncbi:hypothetical protein GC175_23235 [bacterium]|nr:hypothetical protein [bacterium]
MNRCSLFLFVCCVLLLLTGLSAANTVAAQELSIIPQVTGHWRSGGPFDATMTPIPVADVVASPDYAADATLFAATNQGVFRSSNGGRSWQAVLQPPPGALVRFNHVRISPAFAYDGTLFVAYENETDLHNGLYISRDRGMTWTEHADVGKVDALAVSPNYGDDETLFVGRQRWIYKSTDGGNTWTAYALASEGEGYTLFDLAVSPNYVMDQTIFASGFGPMLRSVDGGVTWQNVGGYGPSYEIALSPNYTTDKRIWAGYRSIEAPGDDTPESSVFRSIDRGATWQLTPAGLPGFYEPFPRHLAVSPDYDVDQTLFTALSGQFVAGTSHSLLRSFNGGDSWIDLGPAPGNPDVHALAVTSPATDGIVAHVATNTGVWHYQGGACIERIADGGFETPYAWKLPTTPRPATYSTAIVHSGVRSLHTGITQEADLFSYSSAGQQVTIPADAISANLTLWWYPISAEGSLPADVAAADAIMPDEASAMGDRHYVLLLDEAGVLLERLLWTRSDAATWQPLHFDLSSYAGQRVRVHLGTLNDGDGRKSAMYVDDVSLVICRAQTFNHYLPSIYQWQTLLLPEGQAKRIIGRPQSATVYAEVGIFLYRSEDAGIHWQISGTTQPTRILLGHTPGLLYAGDGWGCMSGGEPSPMYRSVDGGLLWHEVPAGWNLGVLALHSEKEWIYAAACGGVYRSEDAGATFTFQTGPPFGILEARLMAPADAAWRKLWVGGMSEGGAGTVLLSEDGGATWDYAMPLEPFIGWLVGLELDRADPTILYAPAYYGFWQSEDDGATWVERSTGLETIVGEPLDGGIEAFAQVPGDERRHLLGTEKGLYSRNGLDAAWTKINGTPFDDLRITDLLVLDAAPQRVFVTTEAGVFVYTLN